MNRRSLFSLIGLIPAAFLGRKAIAAAPVALPPVDGDYCWNPEDWEATYDMADICLLADDIRFGDVMRISRAVKIADIWIAKDDDHEVHEFSTEAEALAFAKAISAGMDA
jgi:hypothetical protein